MTTRRVLVWVIAAAIGLAASVGVIVVFNTTLDKFSVSNAVLVTVSIGSLAFIWLDYALKTQYLKS
jgi:hypothetical protein